MKTWWLNTGWPWLKENWWVTLLIPVMALAYAGMYFMNRPVAAVADPLEADREREKLEAETRVRQLEEEKVRLEQQLADLNKKYQDLEANMETRLASRVEELRSNPDALRDAMLRAGTGGT